MNCLMPFVFSSRPEITRKPPAQRHLVARRAAQFVKENVDEIVTLRAMCEYVGVSERSLRQGFLERFGVPPKTYIKRFRLHQLHDLLHTSTLAELTVTRGALNFGLTHLGRLSADYHALFGELPSTTLHRSLD